MSDEDLKRFWSKSDGTPVDIDSRDQLAPVLAKLSDEQWRKFTEALADVAEAEQVNNNDDIELKWLLTCPPRVLAESIAMVVKEGR